MRPIHFLLIATIISPTPLQATHARPAVEAKVAAENEGMFVYFRAPGRENMVQYVSRISWAPFDDDGRDGFLGRAGWKDAIQEFKNAVLREHEEEIVTTYGSVAPDTWTRREFEGARLSENKSLQDRGFRVYAPQD